MKKYQTGGEIDPLTGLTVEAPEPTEIKVKKPRKRKPLNILESLDFSAIDPSEEEKAKIFRGTTATPTGLKDLSSYHKYLGEDISSIA